MNSEKIQALFIAICISLVVLPSTIAFPAYSYNNGYSISDLDANDATYFPIEANNFVCTTLVTPGVKTTTCNGYYLLGGYNILSGSNSIGENFARTYSSLQPHNMIYFAFTVYQIDSWDDIDYMIVQFDSTQIKNPWHAGYGISKTNYCGGSGWSDIINNRVFGRVPHSALTLTLKFVSGLDEDPTNESTGFRDLRLTFATTSASIATTQSMCVIPTISYTTGLCGCSEGYYLSGTSCLACNSLCSSCFGPAATDCYACASSAGWNGVACVTCHSTCAACYGPANYQCTTCPSGYVMYNNKYCIPQSYCKSPLAPSSANAYNYVYCTSSCDDTQYIMWDGTCSNTCASPLTISTMTSYLQYCIYPCITSQYLYWDGSCQASCASPLTITTINSKKICNYGCLTSQYLYWDGTCQSSCPSPLTSTIAYSRKFCTDPCSDSQYLYWDGSCQASCALPLTITTINSKNICNYGCPISQYLYWDGTCSSSCPSPLTSTTTYSRKFCTDPCLDSQYLYWDGSCETSCASPLTITTINSKNICNYGCPISQYLYWDGTCSSSCPSPLISTAAYSRKFCTDPCSDSQYLYWDGSCQTSCASPLTITTINGKDICNYGCPISQYLYWDGTCSSSCPSPLTSTTTYSRKFCTDPCLDSQYLYWDGSCETSCASPLTITTINGKNICNYGCPISQFLYWDGSCVSLCNFPLTSSTANSRKFCTDPCAANQFLYWDGTCQSTCPSPLTTTTGYGSSFCTYPCATSSYLYWDGSCETTCASPLIVTTINSKNICNYGCTTAEYLYWDGSCQTSCASPVVAYVTKTKDMCSYPCLANQYLYWDGTCGATCNFPLNATIVLGKNFCNFPCSTGQFLYWNGTCASSCNYPLTSSISNSQNFCTYPCTNSQYLYYNATCGTSCSSPLVTRLEAGLNYCDYPCVSDPFLYWDGTCQSSCAAPVVAVSISTKQFCNYPCLTGQYLYWNGTCASYCSYPLTSSVSGGQNFCTYPCTGSQYLYYNATCGTSCSSPLVTRVEAGLNYCDYPCVPDQSLYWDGTCQSDCDSPLVSGVISNSSFCYYPCSTSETLYWNGTCASSCVYPLTPSISDSRNFCTYPCLSSQYLFFNGSCKSSCPRPLVTRVEAGMNYCEYLCAISEFLYTSSSCASYCVAPFASRKEAGRNYCYRLCPEPQFLLWNGSCIADCDSPLRIRTNTSGTYCLFPCDNITEYYNTETRTCGSVCDTPNIPAKHMYLECLPGILPSVTFSKLLHHLRYLDIVMPQKLKNITIAREMNILSLRTSRGLFTQQAKHSVDSGLPHIFERNNLDGSFLTNFIQDLFILVVIVSSGIISLIFEKFSAWRKLTCLQTILHKYRILTLWNLPLIFIATDIGDIIFFSTIEFRTFKLMTTWSTISLVASNIVLIGALCVLLIIIWILHKSSKAEKHQVEFVDTNKTHTQDPFLAKWKGFQVIYQSFKRTSQLTRSFFLLYTMRLALPMIIATSLYQYPLVQSILYVLISLLILILIIWKKPIKRSLDQANLMVLEFIILVVHICILALTVLAHSSSKQGKVQLFIGEIIMSCKYSIDILAVIFLILKLIEGIRIALNLRGQKDPDEKASWIQLLFIPLQQGGMGFEQVQIIPYSQDSSAIGLKSLSTSPAELVGQSTRSKYSRKIHPNLSAIKNASHIGLNTDMTEVGLDTSPATHSTLNKNLHETFNQRKTPNETFKTPFENNDNSVVIGDSSPLEKNSRIENFSQLTQPHVGGQIGGGLSALFFNRPMNSGVGSRRNNLINYLRKNVKSSEPEDEDVPPLEAFRAKHGAVEGQGLSGQLTLNRLDTDKSNFSLLKELNQDITSSKHLIVNEATPSNDVTVSQGTSVRDFIKSDR